MLLRLAGRSLVEKRSVSPLAKNSTEPAVMPGFPPIVASSIRWQQQQHGHMRAANSWQDAFGLEDLLFGTFCAKPMAAGTGGAFSLKGGRRCGQGKADPSSASPCPPCDRLPARMGRLARRSQFGLQDWMQKARLLATEQRGGPHGSTFRWRRRGAASPRRRRRDNDRFTSSNPRNGNRGSTAKNAKNTETIFTCRLNAVEAARRQIRVLLLRN
jgi:hypothetical protein